MKILLAHNRYIYKGGEDIVFDQEKNLLIDNGHEVEELIVDNQKIQSVASKLKTGLKAFYNKDSERILLDTMERFHPDIIHVHNFFPLLSPSIFYAASKHNIPIVLTLHNYRLVCSNAMFLRNNKLCTKCLTKAMPYPAIYHGCYRDSYLQSLVAVLSLSTHNYLQTWNKKIDRIIVLTKFGKEIIIKSNVKIRQDKLLVKPNFVNDKGVSTKARENFFMFVGRLSQEKGIKVLLNAFATLPHRIKIIGGGPDEELVRTFAEKHKNIEYVGFMEREDIFNQLKLARALILPSIIFEGMPMTIIEAFSTGTPVITSNIGAMGDMVVHAENGLKFEVNDIDALANAVNEFTTKFASNTEIYSNARKTYETLYNPESNYARLMEIYNQAINAKKKTHSA